MVHSAAAGTPLLSRRALLGVLGAGLVTALPLGSRRAEAEPQHALLTSPHFILRDIPLPGDRAIGNRMLLLLPRHTKAKVPLLIALHGLGETGDPRTGAHAWIERYGLGSCYERLLSPPIQPLYARARHWSAERLDEVNELLVKQPFRGLAIACPYTPNVYKAHDRKRTLDRYAEWIIGEVLPRARQEGPILADTQHTYLDGCSLGGYVGMEVFARVPQHFAAWGSVQGALGAHRVAAYAKRLEQIISEHGPRAIHLESSLGDPFLADNRQLSALLKKSGIPHDFLAPPGPHNQPFLRDSGTLEMLLWHDRRPRKR